MGGFSPIHLLVLLIVLAISFVPSIVAFARHHRQKWLVLLINVLIGWTGIGWIAALVWAIVGKPARAEPDYAETLR